MANVQMFDRDTGTVVFNETEVSMGAVYDALVGPHPEVAALIRWTVTTHPESQHRAGTLFARDRYVTPSQIFDQFRTAQDAAVHDDIVSTVLESTESLAFARMGFSAEDEDEENIWDQIGFDLDLDSRIREMWRELFTISQFYAVTWWGKKSYKVTGTNPETGVKRRREFPDLTVPLGLSLLDPTKVVPVGNLMFNQEQLAYIADRSEVDLLDAAVLNDPAADPVSRQIIVAKYNAADYERRNLAKLGITTDFLYILNPQNVWRHTATRPQYNRFADVRMISVFELLDLKHQLRQMDRAHLVGGTNFIVLIRKGTDILPAKPEEITNLHAQVRTVSSTPILVGDHRLSVEIVTPKNDLTLSSEKYGTLDSRIQSRLFQMFVIHGQSRPADDSVKLAKVIARGMESRRFMLKRALERAVVAPCVAANDALETMPVLRFHPTRIELDFDNATAAFLQDLRDRGDISRDSILNEFDFDQSFEAIMREREAKYYDSVFTQTNVPYSAPGPAHLVPVGPGGKPNELPGGGAPPDVAPHSHGPTGEPVALPGSANKAPAKKAPADPKTAGRRLGGNRSGGGTAPGTGQGQPPRGRPKNT